MLQVYYEKLYLLSIIFICEWACLHMRMRIGNVLLSADVCRGQGHRISLQLQL